MSKVYLAISEAESIKLNNYLKNKNPDYEFIYIVPNNATDEILNILETPFELLITPVSYIDVNICDPLNIDGQVVILDPSVSNSKKIKEKVHAFESFDKFYIEYLAKGLENKSVQKQNTLQKDSSDTIESEPSNINKTEVTKTEASARPHENHKEKESDKIKVPVHYEESNEPNYGKPVNLVSYPPDIASMMVKDKKNLEEKTNEFLNTNYNYYKFKENKVIGVWSPTPLNGVTSFIINFAIFLTKFKYNISVLEALSKTPTLKERLTQYGSLPDNWFSFFRGIYSNGYNANNQRWIFRDVDWLPIDLNDLKDLEWTYDAITSYLTLGKKQHFSFVDLPHGKMEPSTLHTLEHLDKLWIMVDNTSSLTWLHEIKQISTSYNLPIQLIVTKCYSKKTAKKIANQLGFPLLTVFPSLEEEYQLYEKHHKPLIDHFRFYKKITPAFEEIAANLLGPAYDDFKPSLVEKFKRFIARLDSRQS